MSDISSSSVKSTPIQVLASFSADGQVKPVYLCINGITLKVASAREFLKHGCPIFACEVIDGDTIKCVNVCYHKRDNLWTIR